MTRYIGAHTIDNGGIHMAARRAGTGGMRALQVFTAIPKYYGEKVGVKPERLERFREALAAAKIDGERVVSHAAYVLNTASPDDAKWPRARDGLTKEYERSVTLGIGSVCFHPGAATDGDRDAAAERVAAAITYALEKVAGDTRLLIENTAGAGNTYARTASEVANALRHVPKKLRARTGYGLDTCHLHASGYDITSSPAALKAVLDEFEEATGEPPGFFHLNDSEGACASNVDRHRLIGEGTIGPDTFKWLLHDSRSGGIPLILETPQLDYEIAEDDDAPDPYDLQMFALLSSFVA
ncbi:MAG: endonuclease 4 [Gemmatimonadetes bacterium]|nr:endonuclease 4 [Gemmatimonadota bacterium]